MPTAVPQPRRQVQRASSSRADVQHRFFTWALTFGVLVVATLSLLTDQFNRWIDLRFAGTLIMFVLPAVWAVSAYAVALAPNMNLRRAFLWPTYVMLAMLLANMIEYYHLLATGGVTGRLVPLQGLAFFCLLLWVIAAALHPGKQNILLVRAGLVKQTVWAVFCIAIMSGFLLIQRRPPMPPPSDLALVFGNAVNDDGTASPLLRDRTLAAIKLYKEGKVRKIMLSGSMDPTRGSLKQEPLAMKVLCLQAGIPEQDIILDPTGVNTRASVDAARKVMEQNKWTRVVGVSDDWHLPRIAMTFEQAGIKDAATYASDPQEWQQADPVALAREVAGLTVYAFVPNYRTPKAVSMNVVAPRIVVTKSANTLELFDGDRLVKTYHCITGTNPGQKLIEGDRITPMGMFKVVYKNPESKYHLSMGLNYPRTEDALRGLKQGLISKAEFEQIKYAEATNGIPSWYTRMGGEIMIHGFAEGRDSTAGCVAVTNPEIEELYAICDVGTVVEIRP